MDSGSIKSSGVIRPQDTGARPQVRRSTPQAQSADIGGAGSQSAQQQARHRVADPENLVSANGRTYDRSAPKGTYLNIVV